MKKLEVISIFMNHITVETLDRWEIAEIAENIVDLCDIDFDDAQVKILAAALDAGFDAEESLNRILNGDYRLYEGVYFYDSLGEEILAEQLQGDDFLETIAPFIDYERYGRAYCTNNTCYFTKYGVLETF